MPAALGAGGRAFESHFPDHEVQGMTAGWRILRSAVFSFIAPDLALPTKCLPSIFGFKVFIVLLKLPLQGLLVLHGQVGIAVVHAYIPVTDHFLYFLDTYTGQNQIGTKGMSKVVEVEIAKTRFLYSGFECRVEAVYGCTVQKAEHIIILLYPDIFLFPNILKSFC